MNGLVSNVEKKENEQKVQQHEQQQQQHYPIVPFVQKYADSVYDSLKSELYCLAYRPCCFKNPSTVYASSMLLYLWKSLIRLCSSKQQCVKEWDLMFLTYSYTPVRHWFVRNEFKQRLEFVFLLFCGYYCKGVGYCVKRECVSEYVYTKDSETSQLIRTPRHHLLQCDQTRLELMIQTLFCQFHYLTCNCRTMSPLGMAGFETLFSTYYRYHPCHPEKSDLILKYVLRRVVFVHDTVQPNPYGDLYEQLYLNGHLHERPLGLMIRLNVFEKEDIVCSANHIDTLFDLGIIRRLQNFEYNIPFIAYCHKKQLNALSRLFLLRTMQSDLDWCQANGYAIILQTITSTFEQLTKEQYAFVESLFVFQFLRLASPLLYGAFMLHRCRLFVHCLTLKPITSYLNYQKLTTRLEDITIEKVELFDSESN